MLQESLKKYRVMRGLTQQQLAESVGVAKSTISMYETGNREPDFEMLEAIADTLNVNLASLVSDEVKHSVLVPVLGYVRAGIPIEAVEEILDYEEISSEMASQGEHFGLRIKGDSMEPKFSDGDVVIVRKQESVDNGCIAVVLVNGSDATVKKFYKTDAGVKLISTNPKYDPFFFPPEEVESLPVRVIGRVVELRAKF